MFKEHQKKNTKENIVPYEDFLQHLTDELSLLDLKLFKKLKLHQKSESGITNSAKSFFLAHNEILTLLDNSQKEETDTKNDHSVELIDNHIKELKEKIEARLSVTEKNGCIFPVRRLAKILNMQPAEYNLLIMAVASEIDRKYEKIYSFFNDDLSKKQPSFDLAFDLSFDSQKEKLSACNYILKNSSLIFFKIINFSDSNETSFFNRSFKADERIFRYVIGDNNLSSDIAEIVSIYNPDGYLPIDRVKETDKNQIAKILSEKSDGLNKTAFWLFGKAEEDKRNLLFEISEDNKLQLLTVSIEDIFYRQNYETILKDIFREALIRPAMIHFVDCARLYQPDERSEQFTRMFLNLLNEMSWITFFSAENMWIPPDYIRQNYPWYTFEFNLPDYQERKKIWERILKGFDITENEKTILAGRLNFTQTRIRKTIAYAEKLGPRLTFENICKAGSMLSNTGLNVYAKKMKPAYKWEDIVLTEDKLQNLKEICNHIKYKSKVYSDWGFEKKLSLGSGINILFSGPSGTGKTMSAEIFANELKLDIYKIDLSMVVSKYIGETEKNLAKIFKEAESSNVIIFFDEADALFGKRSEVKDAHDRYANIETGYLLQKLEEHEGIVIMASNLSKNIDEAFQRRMRFIVEFPFPNEDARKGIWDNIFPKDAPLDENIDFEFIANKFKLTGGNIKNAALNAAFLAADDSGKITANHIMKALRFEYKKMGCFLTPNL